jgi:glucosamine kinase
VFCLKRQRVRSGIVLARYPQEPLVSEADLAPGTLLLGVDGGGTRCRARLCAPAGGKVGEGVAGPANIRLGMDASLAAVLQATRQCLQEAGLSNRDLTRIAACLALAGASEPAELAAARAWKHPFGSVVFTTDAHAACVGAHGGRDGGVIIAGTGSIGWAFVGGRQLRVGGWGFDVSDEGSGAWLGREVLRQALWTHDGRTPRTALLDTVLEHFQRDPHAIVRFASDAAPRDFGAFAPLVVEYAKEGDSAAVELMRRTASHVDRLAKRLIELGAPRLALAGGLAPHLEHWISRDTKARLVTAAGDALDGALQLAQAAAHSVAA